MVLEKSRIGWRFGTYPFDLLVKARRLMRGDQIVPLTDIEMSLLLLLVQKDGQVVRKEEIVATVWAGRPVGDGVVSTTFLRLRGKIGDSVIATVHGVGYYLACATEPLGGIEERRAEYLTALFIQADAERQSMPDAEWDRKYVPEFEQVRVTLDWSLESRQRRHVAVGLAGATGRLWERVSRLPEGRTYLDRAVELLDSDTPPEAAARLLRYAGTLWREADRARALALLQQSASKYRELRDNAGLGPVLGLVGDAQLHLGYRAAAKQTLSEAEKLLATTTQTKALWNVLNALGDLWLTEDDAVSASKYFNLARDLAQMLNDKLREFLVVVNMAELEFRQGSVDRAAELAREAAAGLRDAPLGYRCRPIVNLAAYEILRGKTPQARTYAKEALSLCSSEGGYWLRLCLQVWALIAASEDKDIESAQLLGFVDGQFKRFGEARQQLESDIYSMITVILSRTLSQDRMDASVIEGEKWSEAQAVEFVSSRLLASRTANSARTTTRHR